MKKIRTWILLLVAIGAACTSSTPHSNPPEKLAVLVEPEALCERVAEIKSIPFKDERVNDAAYNDLVNAGEEVVPCLIEKITDTTPMPDPRSIPGPTETKVGDVAFFVLIDVAKLDFDSMMPPEVKNRLKDEGVYAYHEFVGEEANRKRLQSTLQEWYRQKYGTYPSQRSKGLY